MYSPVVEAAAGVVDLPKLKVTGVTAALKLESKLEKNVTVKTRFEQSYVKKPTRLD